jgi:uncharacterized protein (TIGR02611 family)
VTVPEHEEASPEKARRRRLSEGRSFWHRTAIRMGIAIAGFAVIVAGVILALPGVPGPGFLLVLAGLGILATEFEWAERWLHRARVRFDAAARRAGVDPKKARLGAILTFVLVAVAALVAWLVLR